MYSRPSSRPFSLISEIIELPSITITRQSFTITNLYGSDGTWKGTSSTRRIITHTP